MEKITNFTWRFQNARLTAVIVMDGHEISYAKFNRNLSELTSKIKNNMCASTLDVTSVGSFLNKNIVVSVIISKIDSKCDNFICKTNEFDEFLQDFIGHIRETIIEFL